MNIAIRKEICQVDSSDVGHHRHHHCHHYHSSFLTQKCWQENGMKDVNEAFEVKNDIYSQKM